MKKLFSSTIVLLTVLLLSIQVWAADFYIDNSTQHGGVVTTQWVANTAYSLGARVVCTRAYATQDARSMVYECTTAGTTGASQPTWDYASAGNTTSDGTVTWTARTPTSWENASAYLEYVANKAGVANGDTIYILSTHSESTALSANIYLIFSTSPAAPSKIISCTSDLVPTYGARITYTGAYQVWLFGAAYSYGVKYTSGAIFASGGTNGSVLTFDGGGGGIVLALTTAASGAGGYITPGTNSYAKPYYFRVINGDIQLGRADQFMVMHGGTFEWRNGSLIAPSGTNILINSGTVGISRDMLFEDVDLSAVGESGKFFDIYHATNFAGPTFIRMNRCKIPGSTFHPIASLGTEWFAGDQGFISLSGCSSSNSNVAIWDFEFGGITKSEYANYLTAGAVSGSEHYSLSLDTTYGFVAFPFPNLSNHTKFSKWNSSTSEITVTVEGMVDSATNLTNKEVWLEVEYPADNTSGLGTIASNRGPLVAAATDLTASTATWTTSGITNENKFKLQVTFTPGRAGLLSAKVYLAKPTTKIYINPQMSMNNG